LLEIFYTYIYILISYVLSGSKVAYNNGISFIK
jgi:hypothetical protein